MAGVPEAPIGPGSSRTAVRSTAGGHLPALGRGQQPPLLGRSIEGDVDAVGRRRPRPG